MATRSRRPPAPLPEPAPAGPAGRDVRMAVALGVLLGQVGYIYTRQTRRLLISMAIGTFAIAVALIVVWGQLPVLDFTALGQDPTQAMLEYDHKLLAALGLPSVVGVLNNLACAVDLYFQVSQANRRR